MQCGWRCWRVGGMLLRVRASQPMVQLPPNTDAIGIALDAEHREALDEVMGLGMRNENVLSWLERWRYDWPTHPFLVAGCSLSRQRRGDHSENESAAGGLARDWAEALTLVNDGDVIQHALRSTRR
jgi:hypothetical protein